MTRTMRYDLQYDPEAAVIRVATHGTIDLASLRQMLAELKAASRKHDCARYLLDHTDSDHRLGVTEIYHQPNVFSDLGFTWSDKAAIVFATEDADFQFFEDVACNRGYRVRVFTDVTRAMEWLTAE